VCVVFIATYEKFHLGEQYMDEVKKPYFWSVIWMLHIWNKPQYFWH
jgi:hypothetical protein